MIQALEHCRNNRWIAKISAFQRSVWYAVCVAAVSLLSHLFGLELAAFWVLILASSFALVMQEDTTPLVPTVFMIYYAISRKHGCDGWQDIGVWTTAPYIANIACFGAIFVAALVFHIVYYKQYTNFKRRTFLTAGLAALATSFITNGWFAPEFEWRDLWYGLSYAALYYGVYVLFFHTVQWKKRDSLRYLAFNFFIMGLLVAAELGILYILVPELHGGGDVKGYVRLGWGISNSIAFTFMLSMPFGFYLSYKEKHPLPYFLGTAAMLIAVIFTYARAALIIAVPLFVAGTIFLCLFAKRRLGVWIVTGIAVVGAIIIAVNYRGWLLEKLNFYITAGFKDHGRFTLWKECLEAFLVTPVFGEGLYWKYGEVSWGSFFWAHNTPLQMLATCGLFGLLAYLFHRVQTVIMFVRKPTCERLFAGLAVLCLVVNSLLDVAMSCQNIILYYGILLAFAEKDYMCSTGVLDENGRPIDIRARIRMPEPDRAAAVKARVLFPFVDAGSAYTQAIEKVADAFRAKYGEQTDVTVVPFFDAPDAPSSLKDFEQALRRTAHLQNKKGYRNVSVWAAKVFRRRLLQTAMQSYVPTAYGDALQRMADFDADLVFSTHWATAYYAAQLNKAINIEYCADGKCDTLWHTGADTLLVPSALTAPSEKGPVSTTVVEMPSVFESDAAAEQIADYIYARLTEKFLIGPDGAVTRRYM